MNYDVLKGLVKGLGKPQTTKFSGPKTIKNISFNKSHMYTRISVILFEKRMFLVATLH